MHKEIILPDEIKYIKKSSSAVLEALKNKDLDESDLFNIRLCIEEAVRNAMEHGNKFDKNKKVKFCYSIDKNALKVVVEDEGKGFSNMSLSDPTANDNLLSERGRGVFLIKKLMDEVQYSKKGNQVTMIKRLSSRRS